MLQNLSHKYYSHNNNMKCVGSTIKCLGFELIHYVINLNVVSSFMIFSNFLLYVLYRCIVSLNQLNYFSPQKKYISQYISIRLYYSFNDIFQFTFVYSYSMHMSILGYHLF